MEIEGYLLPDDLYYHKEHMWVKLDGEKATVGITDFAVKLAGEISFIEFPQTGDEVSQDDVIGTIETGKWVGKIYAPLSGEVLEINTDAEDDPAIVNEDPYGKGWLFKIKVNDEAELSKLFKGDSASSWLKGEIEKHKK